MDESCLGKVLCKNMDGSILYGTSWNELKRHNIMNWSLNRPYDIKRIPEIVEQLKKQDYVDGIIYMTKEDNKLVCYDGIHRIEALKNLEHDDFSDINHKIVVHYYPIYNEMKIKNKFETLNKCVPVPELYTSAHKELCVKKLIESVAKYFQDKYSQMFKGSKNPNIPHENRDNFIDKLLYIITELNFQDFSFDNVIYLLGRYNNYIIHDIQNRNIKLTNKQLSKCEKMNCYLFTSKNWDHNFMSWYISNINVKS